MATSKQESALEMELDQEFGQTPDPDPVCPSQPQLADADVMDVQPESTGRGTDGNNAPTLSELANLAIARAKEAKLKKLKAISNKLVLAEIAKSLSPGRLLKLRGTCTAWNSDFVPQLKKTHSPVRLNSSKTRTLEGIGTVLQSSSVIPFSRFGFHPKGNTRDRDRESFQNILTSFGNKIKRLDIKWDRRTDFSVAELRKLIFELTPDLEELRVTPSGSLEGKNTTIQELQALPKLKRITVNFNDIHSNNEVWNFTDQPYAAVIQLMTGVIAAAQDLDALYFVERVQDMERPTLARLLESQTAAAADAASAQSHIHKLKTLNTSLLTNADLRLLINLARQNGNFGIRRAATVPGLCLDSFQTSVNIWEAPDEDDSDNETDDEDDDDDRDERALGKTFGFLHDFLASQSPTMKELTIEYEYDENRCLLPLASCKLPSMEQLKKLALVDYGLGIDEVSFPGKFMDAFPQLRQFTCSKYEVDEAEFDFKYSGSPPKNDLNKFHHPGVTDFHLTTYADGGYTGIRDFRPVFPSLTKLELKFTPDVTQKVGLHMDVEEVAQIWNMWPALTVIHLTWEGNDLNFDVDSFLSGVPRKKLEILRHTHKLDFRGPPFADPVTPKALHGMVKKFKIWAGVCDLKQLQEFKLHFEGRDKPQLTDMGGYFGLALASRTLQRIVIQGEGKNLVSKQCMAVIRNRFGLLAELSI